MVDLPRHLTDPANRPLPRIVQVGLEMLGVREAPGAANNPIIMGWAEEIGEDAIGYRYTGDAVAWCGLAMAVMANRTGRPIPTGPLWALNWSNWQIPVARRRGLSLKNPLVFEPGLVASLGDVMTYRRPGGGHVGVYIGETADAHCVLGGNQGNAMSLTWIEKSRCVAIRRPAYKNPPASVKPWPMSRSGALSRNEA